MKLKDILTKESVCGELLATDKKEVLEELASLTSGVYPQLSAEEILKVLLEREKLGSTGVGNGVAIPHGKIAGLDHIVAIFGRSNKGIDFNSHDNKNTHLFFVLLAPENAAGNHLHVLARLSRLLKTEETRNLLIETKPDQLFQALIAQDEKI